MKTKIKRHYRSVLSVVLAVCMLVSCMTVGLIATDAARDKSEDIGYSGATLYYKTNNSGTWSSGTSVSMAMSNSNNTGTATVSLAANTTYYFVLVADNGDWFGNNPFNLSSTTSVTKTLGKYYNFSSGSNNVSSNPNTLTTSTAASYTFTITLSSGSCTVSGGSGKTDCSTGNTYTVVGTAGITGEAWNKDSTSNNMTDSAGVGYYKKTYSNIAANTDHDFRIIKDHTWSTTWGFSRANKIDASNIVSTWSAKPNDSDNNIRIRTTQKANIEIRFDDSKEDTSAITIIVTPAIITVTAGSPYVSNTVTNDAGYIKVNDAASVTNVAQGGTVTVKAIANYHYHFVSWRTDDNLTFANANAATTNVTVAGSATVNANFAKDKYSVTKTNSDYYTLTSNSSSVEWGTSVTGTATPASGYAVSNVTATYVDDNDETQNVAVTFNSSTGAYSFTMPKGNVTVAATYSELANGTLNFGVNGQGYISVGKQHGSTQNQIEQSYTTGATVLQGTKVNFCAIPKKNYKFVGWYTDSGCTAKAPASLFTTGSQTTKDVTVTMPGSALTLYAKFEQGTDPAYSSTGVRLLFKKSDYQGKNYCLYAWTTSGSTDTKRNGDWPGGKVTDLGTVTSANGTVYYTFYYNTTTLKYIMNTGSGGNQTGDLSKTTGTYTIAYAGETTATTSTYTSQAGNATTDVYPIVLDVTNPEDDYNGNGTATYAPAYATKSATFVVNHKPDNDHKINLTKVGYTGTAGTNSTTLTMPSSYSSSNKVTVTYDELAYFPVTFSAGPNGSVQACTGSSWNASNAIKSGTLVKENTYVTFKATANSGYSFAKWTGNSTSTNSTIPLQINAAKDVKGWFKNSDKGTAITSPPYFDYSTTLNYQQWDDASTTLYHKNGKVYAYIDSVTNGTTYYFSIASNDSPKDNLSGDNLAAGLYGWSNEDKCGITVSTDFTGYLSYTGVQEYGVSWNYNDGQGDKHRGTVYYGKTTINSSAVTGLIIECGEWKDGNYNYNANYRVTPIYDTDVTNVDIYAKDGSYRGDSQFDYFPGIADTVISAKTGSTISNRKQQSEFETASAMRGQTIVVTTTIDSSHKNDFYIRGFSFNGVTPALLTSEDGVANGTGIAYSQEYTIPADFDYDYLEITPIYYYKVGVGADNFVQFYIENYDKALEATGWGNTLAVYPYYQHGSDYVEKKQNAFGGYPGQPVIYYGGRRFIEIPTHYYTFPKDNNNETAKECTIKGVTLSNDYWDVVHREYCHAVTEHKQTYDYDDFVKIYRETSDNQEKNGKTGLADQITFQFKYRTQTNNFADSSVKSADKNTGSTAAGNTVHQPYSSFTTSEKGSKFGNGWEPLLDYLDRPVDLFGKQLTDAQKELDPILVVSDDYEVTYAGSYATTWTVYARATSSSTTYTKIAEIAPSALIVTSKARLDSTTLYPVTADQGGLDPTTLQEFSSAYNTLLSYKERPVQITYESAIENNSSYEKYYNKSGVVTNGWISEKAVRNDGRWTYSYYNDDVQANILIQYKNDENDENWTVDTFKDGSNQGTVTGAKAYFTNSDLNKAGESFANKTETGTVVSDQNKFYEFEATATSGYVFAGWWFSRDGVETDINSDHSLLTGHSQMTSNATFIARYIKAPTGTLTVNHTLSSGSVGNGTTYVKIVAINKTTNDRTLLTGDGTENNDMNDYTENQAGVDSSYVGYKKDYRFEITLRTVTASDFDVFDRFSAANDEPSQNHFNGNYTEDRNTSTGQNTVTSTSFTVDNEEMFAINAQGFPTQQFDTLTYFSNLEHLNIGYSLTYSYNSKVGSNNYYGTQSYLVTGIFTKDEFNKYLNWDSTLVTNDHETGWYKLNSKAGEFLAIKAPHEATIRGNLNWDFTSSYGTVSYFKNNQTDGMDGQITVSKSAVQEEITTKRLQYIFPYRVTNTNNGTVAQQTDGKVVMLKETDNPKEGVYSKYLTKTDARFGKPYELNWQDVAQSGAEPVYVTAENMVYVRDESDSSILTPQYFQYWSIETVPTGVATDENNIPDSTTYVSHEVGRCYNLGFNFSVYQDYIVRPVYSTTVSTKEHTDNAAITWAENGRNQWNLDNGSAKWNFGDRIFTDFMISYDRQDKLMISSVNDKSVTVGIVTERLDTILDANVGSAQEGQWAVQSEAYYNTKYASRDSNKAAITAYIQGRAATANVPALPGISYNTGNGKFVLADADNYENSFINTANLDNKNRIEFTKVVPNISQSDKSDTGRKNYVYRAYAYMIDWNMENGVPKTIKSIQISNPVYYTIYDIATIENGKGISRYTV